MPAKVDTYLDLARETALGLAGSVGAWTAFLDTSSRLYKYPFHDQLMIHAQRPGATACASYEVWNDTMRRYVRRGAKGIALVDNSGDAPKLRYVFDIADTGTRRSSRPFSPWQINDGNLAEVQLGLRQAFNAEGEWLSSQLQDEHHVELGEDARGNISRIENALTALDKKLGALNTRLTDLQRQVENAREELEKPFPQEDELREKSARLVELNAELDMENNTEPQEAEKPSVLAKLKEPIPLYEPKTHQVKYEEACR